jgi:hypothetical protein
MRIRAGAVSDRSCDAAIVRDPGENATPRICVFAAAVIGHGYACGSDIAAPGGLFRLVLLLLADADLEVLLPGFLVRLPIEALGGVGKKYSEAY